MNSRIKLCSQSDRILSATHKNIPSDVCPAKKNQPVHQRFLTRVFIVSMKKLCILGYPKYAHWRFWSDYMDAQADLNLNAHVWRYIFWRCGSYILQYPLIPEVGNDVPGWTAWMHRSWTIVAHLWHTVPFSWCTLLVILFGTVITYNLWHFNC